MLVKCNIRESNSVFSAKMHYYSWCPMVGYSFLPSGSCTLSVCMYLVVCLVSDHSLHTQLNELYSDGLLKGLGLKRRGARCLSLAVE